VHANICLGAPFPAPHESWPRLKNSRTFRCVCTQRSTAPARRLASARSAGFSARLLMGRLAQGRRARPRPDYGTTTCRTRQTVAFAHAAACPWKVNSVLPGQPGRTAMAGEKMAVGAERSAGPQPGLLDGPRGAATFVKQRMSDALAIASAPATALISSPSTTGDILAIRSHQGESMRVYPQHHLGDCTGPSSVPQEWAGGSSMSTGWRLRENLRRTCRKKSSKASSYGVRRNNRYPTCVWRSTACMRRHYGQGYPSEFDRAKFFW